MISKAHQQLIVTHLRGLIADFEDGFTCIEDTSISYNNNDVFVGSTAECKWSDIEYQITVSSLKEKFRKKKIDKSIRPNQINPHMKPRCKCCGQEIKEQRDAIKKDA